MDSKCACSPQLADALINITRDGSPIRLMTILFDMSQLAEDQQLLNKADRAEVSRIFHLVSCLAEEPH